MWVDCACGLADCVFVFCLDVLMVLVLCVEWLASGLHVLRPTLIYSIHVSVSVLCAIYFSVVRYSNSVLFHFRKK